MYLYTYLFDISSLQFVWFVISFTDSKIFRRENCLTFGRITTTTTNNNNNNNYYYYYYYFSYIKEKVPTATNNFKRITIKVRTHTKLGLLIGYLYEINTFVLDVSLIN